MQDMARVTTTCPEPANVRLKVPDTHVWAVFSPPSQLESILTAISHGEHSQTFRKMPGGGGG